MSTKASKNNSLKFCDLGDKNNGVSATTQTNDSNSSKNDYLISTSLHQ